MRLSRLSLIAAGILAAAGRGLGLAAHPNTLAEPEPRHPITDDMRREAEYDPLLRKQREQPLRIRKACELAP